MPTSTWSGHLTFGLISMPVRLFSGARSSGISFNMLHRTDKSRLKQQYVCLADGQVVDRADIVKGRVRSAAALERACVGVRACVEAQGWRTLGLIPSPILGGAGAREFLIAARHG